MKLTAAAILSTVLALGAAAPAPLPDVPATGPGVVKPTTRSQYEVSTGAISYNTGVGKVIKTGGAASDITTLVTFDFPADAAGKTCEFHFFLDGAQTVSGSGLLDVFTSLAPATASTSSWPPGNQRDQHVARLAVSLGAEAAYVDGFPNSIKSFPCPSGTWAAEFVGVYDVDDIEWTGTASSSYITYN